MNTPATPATHQPAPADVLMAMLDATLPYARHSDFAQGALAALGELYPCLLVQQARHEASLLGRLAAWLDRLSERLMHDPVLPKPDLQQFKKWLHERCIPAHGAIGPDRFAQLQHAQAHELLNVRVEGVHLQCVRIARGEQGQQRFLVRVHPAQEAQPLLLALAFAPPAAQQPPQAAQDRHGNRRP